MPDREKVIKALECCIDVTKCGSECPYWDDNSNCRSNMEADALALLKAQEPREMSDAELMDAIREAPIMIIPAVDAAPVVHGRWVKVSSYVTPGGDPVWKCSECGKGEHVYGIEHGSYGAGVADGQWVSCPNCGAKMDKED